MSGRRKSQTGKSKRRGKRSSHSNIEKKRSFSGPDRFYCKFMREFIITIVFYFYLVDFRNGLKFSSKLPLTVFNICINFLYLKIINLLNISKGLI